MKNSDVPYYQGALCLIKNTKTKKKIGILTGYRESFIAWHDGKLVELKSDSHKHFLYEVCIISNNKATKILLSPIDFSIL